MKDKKYILITKDLHNSLIEFLDEIQFDIAGNDDKESMHKVNFISWAIGELVNSFEAYFPKKKSREDYVDETFMDWNLPEMNDEDYEKLVDQVDGFLKGWEKEYKKKQPKKKSIKKSKSNSIQEKEKFNKPHINDVAEYMSLDEIKEYLLDDEELSNEEAFDLYYEEHRRVEDDKNSMSYDELLKKSGLKPPIKN
tara:strand:+ start:31 stop:615 length:585 start_codon:yes stop_codon:yes gene_type:complete